jgi:hypothetical protein
MTAAQAVEANMNVIYNEIAIAMGLIEAPTEEE